MVRLLLEVREIVVADMVSFNPTMVRLLLVWWDHLAIVRITFQSHNGAIAAQG